MSDEIEVTTNVLEAPETETEVDKEITPIWPEDWRQRFAGNDENTLKRLNRFTSPEGIYKAWRGIEKKMSAGQLKPVKPDTDDPEVLAAWRAEVGIPNEAEEYVKSLPDDIDIKEEDIPTLTRVFKTMHEQGMPVAQASAVVKEYYKIVGEELERRAEVDKEYKLKAEDELRSEWGPEYRSNINSIALLMDEYGNSELLEQIQSARMADGTRLGDNPAMIKFLAGLAREVYPDGNITLTPTSGVNRLQSIQNEIEAIEREMSDTRGRDPNGYWNNPQKQSRYRELMNHADRLQGKAKR